MVVQSLELMPKTYGEMVHSLKQKGELKFANPVTGTSRKKPRMTRNTDLLSPKSHGKGIIARGNKYKHVVA